jgi:hypothetical protein
LSAHLDQAANSERPSHVQQWHAFLLRAVVTTSRSGSVRGRQADNGVPMAKLDFATVFSWAVQIYIRSDSGLFPPSIERWFQLERSWTSWSHKSPKVSDLRIEIARARDACYFRLPGGWGCRTSFCTLLDSDSVGAFESVEEGMQGGGTE